jgi:hypothetical protein
MLTSEEPEHMRQAQHPTQVCFLRDDHMAIICLFFWRLGTQACHLWLWIPEILVQATQVDHDGHHDASYLQMPVVIPPLGSQIGSR